MKTLRMIAAALAAGCLASCAQAQVKPRLTEPGGEPAQSVLFVGNSFFYCGINRHIGGISNAAGKDGRLRTTMVTMGGAGIDWHDLDAYLKPGSKGW